MRVLITGGAGFIGSNLARAALAEGHEIVVLDDLSTGYAANLDGLAVRFHEGSVNDRDALDAALQDVDAVVHLAALGSVPRSILDPVATHHANATGTLSVLEGARRAGVGHVVMSSSSSVYGLNPALPKSEREWVRPLSPYAVSKLAGEQYLLAYQQSFGLETLAFRFFNVYGPRQTAGPRLRRRRAGVPRRDAARAAGAGARRRPPVARLHLRGNGVRRPPRCRRRGGSRTPSR